MICVGNHAKRGRGDSFTHLSHDAWTLHKDHILNVKQLGQVKCLKVDFRNEASYESGISVTQTDGRDGAGLIIVIRQAPETLSARRPNRRIHLVHLPQTPRSLIKTSGSRRRLAISGLMRQIGVFVSSRIWEMPALRKLTANVSVRGRHRRADDFYDIAALNVDRFNPTNSSDEAFCHGDNRQIQDLEFV
jgi:hypothetical protein